MFVEYYSSHTLAECKRLIKTYADRYNIYFVMTDAIRPFKALSTINDDNTYTIMLSPDMTCDERIKKVCHEFDHIINDDFHSDLSADEIEYRTHAMDT